MTRFRLAADTDAQAVQALFASYVQTTFISFELEPPTVADMQARIHKTLQRFPWLICESDQGDLLGYVYASNHRDPGAYQWSANVSAYIDPRFHRLGIGRGLYVSLFAVLRLQGYFNAFAGIALPNAASVGLHTALGFEPVGVYRNVGYKLGAWHAVGWWSLSLQALIHDPPTPRTLAEAMRDPGWETTLNAGLPLVRL